MHDIEKINPRLYVLKYEADKMNLGEDMTLKDVEDIFGRDFTEVIKVNGGYKVRLVGAIRYDGANPNDPIVNPPEVFTLEQLKDMARKMYEMDRQLMLGAIEINVN